MILEKAKSEIIRKGEIQENTVGIDVVLSLDMKSRLKKDLKIF